MPIQRSGSSRTAPEAVLHRASVPCTSDDVISDVLTSGVTGSRKRSMQVKCRCSSRQNMPTFDEYQNAEEGISKVLDMIIFKFIQFQNKPFAFTKIYQYIYIFFSRIKQNSRCFFYEKKKVLFSFFFPKRNTFFLLSHWSRNNLFFWIFIMKNNNLLAPLPSTNS